MAASLSGMFLIYVLVLFILDVPVFFSFLSVPLCPISDGPAPDTYIVAPLAPFCNATHSVMPLSISLSDIEKATTRTDVVFYIVHNLWEFNGTIRIYTEHSGVHTLALSTGLDAPFNLSVLPSSRVKKRRVQVTSPARTLITEELRIGAACQSVHGCPMSLSGPLQYREVFQLVIEAQVVEPQFIFEFDTFTAVRSDLSVPPQLFWMTIIPPFSRLVWLIVTAVMSAVSISGWVAYCALDDRVSSRSSNAEH
jgi:hypothetical protein